MGELVRVTQYVLGDDWLEEPGDQVTLRAYVRQEFDRTVTEGHWRLLEEPIERTQYDEGAGKVILTVQARCVSELLRGPSPG